MHLPCQTDARGLEVGLLAHPQRQQGRTGIRLTERPDRLEFTWRRHPFGDLEHHPGAI